MNETNPRIIKKYANRRLYDTEKSSYITLDELKNLVVGGHTFCVRDAKSGEDLTRATLLQVLLSEESFNRPVFSEQNLRNLVTFFHGPMCGPMAAYFEQCLPVFLESQSKLQSKFGNTLSAAAMENITALQGHMARQVLEQYVLNGMDHFLSAQKQMHDNMQNVLGNGMFKFPNMPEMPNFFAPPDKDKK